jgi:hypothetical protein
MAGEGRYKRGDGVGSGLFFERYRLNGALAWGA